MTISVHGSGPRRWLDSPDDLAWVSGFVTDHPHRFQLLRTTVSWDERIRARRTASFGRPYDYSGLTYEAADFPATLEALRRAVAAAVGWTPNNCLLNLYVDGRSTMGLHADAVQDLEPGSGIAIVSLGAARSLVFRAAGDDRDAFALEMSGGSLLHMPLAMQAGWRHGIRREPGAGPRISATFRRLGGPSLAGHDEQGTLKERTKVRPSSPGGSSP